MDAIDVILQTLRELEPGRPEREYQSAVERKLTDAGLPWRRSRRAGLGDTDLYIEGNPPVLVELKRDGDWRGVACGLAQLCIYASDENMIRARKVLVLPVEPMHPECFREMARLLGVEIFV